MYVRTGDIMASEAGEIGVAKGSRVFSAEIAKLRDSQPPEAVVCDLGEGALRFVGLAFPGIRQSNRVFVQAFERDPEGSGPHFDLYGGLVDSRFPWLGVYNLEGNNALTVATLPSELAERYERTYPEPTAEAHDARRSLSAITLADPSVRVRTGSFVPGMGLVLPQRPNGPHTIHEIVPTGEQPGRYLKMLVPPARSRSAREALTEMGYKTLEELVTTSLGRAASRTATSSAATTASSRPASRPSRGFDPMQRLD